MSVTPEELHPLGDDLANQHHERQVGRRHLPQNAVYQCLLDVIDTAPHIDDKQESAALSVTA